MVSLEEFEKEISSIVEKLIRFYKPEKVILFGSLAEGKINEGTDIDFFIIKEDVPELGVERIRQLENLIQYRLATDLIIYKPGEVKQGLRMGDPFIKGIIEQGKVLYDAK